MSDQIQQQPLGDGTDQPLVGQRFIGRDGNTRYECEVISEPALPSYGGDRLFVWARELRAIPSAKGRPRNRQAKLRTTVFFLPLPNNVLSVSGERKETNDQH